ncbi:MAG: carbohydrate ABC transporter permease [Defluviitaleaceae bacterium]|nr:carbohydrate ABC transporter permease [Defluviitaleaceae bacterium]
MTALKAWMNSPSFDNTVQKWTGKVRDFIIGICTAIIIIGVCYVILSPVIGIVSTAFMTAEDMMNPLVFLIPQNLTLSNLNYAVTHMQYFRGPGLSDLIIPVVGFNVTQAFFSLVEGTFIYDAANFISSILSGALLQTLLFSFFLSIVNVIICSMVGYGFARFKFPGSNVLFAIVILTIVVPVHSYMVPMFLNFRYFLGFDWNLLNTWWPLTLLSITGVGIRSGLYIYIFRQFFRGLPKEIEEAAFIDGAGPLYTYTKVMMPNSVPAIVTVLLFSFVWHYNDTFFTSLFMNDANFLSVRLMALGGTFSVVEVVFSQHLIQMVVFGGVLLVIAPILIIYLFLQRYFVEGLERSGIVG